MTHYQCCEKKPQRSLTNTRYISHCILTIIDFIIWKLRYISDISILGKKVSRWQLGELCYLKTEGKVTRKRELDLSLLSLIKGNCLGGSFSNNNILWTASKVSELATFSVANIIVFFIYAWLILRQYSFPITKLISQNKHPPPPPPPIYYSYKNIQGLFSNLPCEN